ncbi:glycosyltransferase [bacterium]|nr:glycosyltransferase [bacterium]
MIRVAHLRDTFLRRTETFIYDIYTRHKTVEAVFLCERTANESNFPTANVYSLGNEPSWRRRLNDLQRGILGEIPFYTGSARSLRATLLHAHFGQTGYYALATKRKLGIPLITSIYGHDVFEVPSVPKWKNRYAAMFAGTDLVLALSEDMRRDLVRLGCPEEKIEIYRLGINLRDFRVTARPERPPRILTVARFVEKKGLEFLIRAVGILNVRGKTVPLRIIGEGPLRGRLEALVAELGLGDQVEFAGVLPFDRLPGEMENADIFCLPSVTDQFGGKDEISMVLKEAMATAMPIVTTIHAGIPEVITDGQTGLLVPERDTHALATALGRLVADAELRRRLGLLGRRLVEKTWDIDRQIERLEDIYRRVAASR